MGMYTVNRSQTHECGNWDRGRPIPFLGKLVSSIVSLQCIPSNRVISSLEGKFGIVGKLFVLVVGHLFMKISNLCKNHL
jgi:hypothetical protein